MYIFVTGKQHNCIKKIIIVHLVAGCINKIFSLGIILLLFMFDNE